MTLSASSTPAPRPESTLLLVAGLIGTAWFGTGETASLLARDYAIGVGVSLTLSFLSDLRGNIRNLVRTDVMALSALYFLTLFEFWFPQPLFDELVSPELVGPALLACVVGFAGIAIGRHMAPPTPHTIRGLVSRELHPRVFVGLFAACLVGGYGYMLVAVNFSVPEMLHYFMRARFAQPWGRGQLGDWKALLVEVGMVLYLVPPIGGVVLARRRDFSSGQIAFVLAGLLFTFFYGFTSGTRNVLATYLATFLVAYAFSAGLGRKKEIAVLSGVVAITLYITTTLMLDFRGVGFSEYMRGAETRGMEVEGESIFFVDYNLYVIAQLVYAFPYSHDFLGMEIPYLALVRPIPRALWPGKPEGMSISIEEALGVEGLTLASTFVGEAYISGGYLGVAITAFLFGVMMCWWNQLGRIDNSSLGHLIFASGFFAAVISMRSMLVFTTAILPTIAILVFGQWAISRGLALRRQHQHRDSHE